MEFLTHLSIVKIPQHRIQVVRDNQNSVSRSLCSSRQTSSQTITSVSSCTMETLYSSASSPNQDNIQYSIPSQLVEQSSNLSKRCSHQELSSFSSIIYRCQSNWFGSSSGTIVSIISWSLDPRPITTPYQSSRNFGHNTCIETSTPSLIN